MNIKDYAKVHRFFIHDLKIYETALTHPSYNQDAHSKHHDYERLEYMGDAVIGYVAADLIFKEHPKMSPGDMSKLRSMLVKTHALATYAKRAHINELIIVGKAMKPEMLAKSEHILENVFESLTGAIYLDNGIKVAYNYVKSFLLNDIKHAKVSELTDAKTRLQEEMQAEHRSSVHYELIESKGPAHDKTFKVKVLFNDIVLASGVGKSKKAAEEDAAKNALKKRKI